jgi:putative PIN family toxin of toxin-antitoxin system
MLAELADVLSREKFDETDERQHHEFLATLARRATMVRPRRSISVITEDPEDDTVLVTAVESKASHVVSGDKHLLDLGQYRGIRIVTPSEMLELL